MVLFHHIFVILNIQITFIAQFIFWRQPQLNYDCIKNTKDFTNASSQQKIEKLLILYIGVGDSILNRDIFKNFDQNPAQLYLLNIHETPFDISQYQISNGKNIVIKSDARFSQQVITFYLNMKINNQRKQISQKISARKLGQQANQCVQQYLRIIQNSIASDDSQCIKLI